MNVLVVGGAGYIGSHFAKQCKIAGWNPVVLDNLSTGHKEFVKFGKFVEGDVRNSDFVETVLKENKIDAVVHFAAKALVPESVENPGLYYSNNTGGIISLVSAMEKVDIKKILFSSTCATYGEAQSSRMGEDHPQNPVNPYGMSKLQCEQILLDYNRLKEFKVGLLRYFNVIGQDPEGELWEWHEPETHLVPNLVKALKERGSFNLFGTDYETRDGTCVRDYVDVNDLGRVHIKALDYLNDKSLLISNVGSGDGYSVREVLTAFKEVFGEQPKVLENDRRPGDPPELVAKTDFFRSWYKEEFKSLKDSIGSLKK